MNDVVVDTSNIVLWVSVCVRNMQDFALAAFKAIWKAYKSKFYYVD